jgi:hypothetical protein
MCFEGPFANDYGPTSLRYQFDGLLLSPRISSTGTGQHIDIRADNSSNHL